MKLSTRDLPLLLVVIALLAGFAPVFAASAAAAPAQPPQPTAQKPGAAPVAISDPYIEWDDTRSVATVIFAVDNISRRNVDLTDAIVSVHDMRGKVVAIDAEMTTVLAPGEGQVYLFMLIGNDPGGPDWIASVQVRIEGYVIARRA